MRRLIRANQLQLQSELKSEATLDQDQICSKDERAERGFLWAGESLLYLSRGRRRRRFVVGPIKVGGKFKGGGLE